MEIIDNRALLLTTTKADQITAILPKSKVLARCGDKARVLVHWGLEEARVLANLGIKKVPHPILGRYDWTGIYTPFEHQKHTAAFLATHPRCLCLSEAGTGKTSAAAWAADYLMRIGEVTRVLVVCPVSIMDTAWRADLFRTVMHRSVGIATGDRHRREKIVAGPYEFVIINFDGVKVIPDALAKGGFDLVIVDEASAYHKVNTDRWKALSALIKPGVRLWMMTGTPAAQCPADAYGLAKLVNPGNVPAYERAFRDQVMYKVTQYKWVPKVTATETVFNALQPAIRYTKAECLDLPDLLYTTREVPLTKQQAVYYEKIKQSMVALAAGEAITAVNAASMLNKLLQISQGVAYTDNKDVVEFDVSNRIEELLSVIENTSHKFIVFVPFRHALLRVQEELNKRAVRLAALAADGNGHAVEVIHGGVSASQRAEIITEFQTGDRVRGVLIIPQAAAHGITLTRADTVVWWGPTTSAELYIQGNARAHRAGQTNKVTVVRLQGSPVERRMYDMLDARLDTHQGLVDLYKEEIA